MVNGNSFSESILVFQERVAPEEGKLAGYGALIKFFDLRVPLPDRLALISKKHKKYETEEWMVLTPRHMPKDTVSNHLTFALKYEGIDLGTLKGVFKAAGAEQITSIITEEPTGQYSRKIWFLYEWLMDQQLPISDLNSGNYADVVDESIQYGTQSEVSKRHRIRNNLPGVRNFCPLIRKTVKLEQYIQQDIPMRINKLIGRIHPDVMARTAAFLLLKDSKASYAIEGESPPQNRAQRWGRAIGQAGQRPLNKSELLRLQQIVIDNPRFVKMGWRQQEGFVGEHDRRHGTPIPDHISARWKDIEQLTEGFLEANEKLEHSLFDAVLAAAVLAFGFVFIHPFADGNGRIHRYLIHHVLLRKHYVPAGIIFPVSSVILEKLNEYRKVLESYSIPRLDLIEWKPASDNNIEIVNETVDLYRYFDATKHAEFLYACIQITTEETIPKEADYLEKYDRFKTYLDDHFEFPDKEIALLVRFLKQGNGKLSERAKSKEFNGLEKMEVEKIEDKYKDVFS